jgi:aminomethyltransferase
MSDLKKTPLHSHHAALGARLVPFAGYEMPLQYVNMFEEHHAVRTGAGVFDVSHMGEIEVRGPQALDFVQYLVPNDASKLADDQALYTAMCYPDGGTVDDLLVYKQPYGYLLVVNASNKDKDVDWVNEQAANFDVEVKDASDDYVQLAVQGPKAIGITQSLLGVTLDEMKSFRFKLVNFEGSEMLVSRTGYTGEDGVEVYCSPDAGVKFWELLMENGVTPIGLGARDSLRFEACLPLYGHEMERDISPVEAGMGWTVKDKPVDYIGKDVLLTQKQNRPRHLIGLKLVDPGVVRENYPVLLNGNVIGKATSGMKAPTLDAFLALALVDQPLEVGTAIQVEIRGQHKAAETIATPFYKRA